MKKDKTRIVNIDLNKHSNLSITLNTLKSERSQQTNSTNNEDQENALALIINLFNEKKFHELNKEALNFNKKYPNTLDGLNALALSFKHLRQFKKAIGLFEKVIELFPDVDFVYANAGNLYFELGNHLKAKEFHEKALEKNPDNTVSMNGLGLILSNAGNDSAAIDIYKKALKINKNDSNTQFNIATSYRKLEQFGKAAKHFKRTNDLKAVDNLLECLYLEAENPESETTIEDFFELLEKAKDSDRLWPSSAALSAHASVRYNKTDKYPFCKDPTKFLQKYNLFDEGLLSDKLVNTFLSDVFNSNLSQRGQSLLMNGEQTSGNLFLLETPSIQKVKKIVEDKIAEYRKNYINSEAGFINRWPLNYTVYGWVIVMNDNGSLSSHIHKEGWMSSSVYLKMPSNLESNQGDIKFSKHGANYPKEKDLDFSEEIVPLIKGDMVMFPSSYFHSTIPFRSKEQRIVLAIDIIPN